MRDVEPHWARLARERQTVKVTIYEQTYPDIPKGYAALLAWMECLVQDVPEEHRQTVEFDFDLVREYGEDYPNLTVTYTRPETDEEWAARRADVEARVMADREGNYIFDSPIILG